jgi:hypothetical protein
MKMLEIISVKANKSPAKISFLAAGFCGLVSILYIPFPPLIPSYRNKQKMGRKFRIPTTYFHPSYINGMKTGKVSGFYQYVVK